MNDERKPRTFNDLIKEHHVDDIQEGEVIEELKLGVIRPNPNQPRKRFDREKIEELAQSIREHGVFQPIIVKRVRDGYIIVSGERRHRAARLAELKTIPCIVRQYEDSKIAEIALIENLQRENLSPIEEAQAYKQLLDTLKISQTELALKVGKSRPHITNTIGLLRLPELTQEFLLTNQISMGHARAISKLRDPKKMDRLAISIVAKQLSVRQAEEITQYYEKTNRIKRDYTPKFPTEEYALTEYLDKKIRIYDKHITIFYNKGELSKLVERIIKDDLPQE